MGLLMRLAWALLWTAAFAAVARVPGPGGGAPADGEGRGALPRYAAPGLNADRLWTAADRGGSHAASRTGGRLPALHERVRWTGNVADLLTGTPSGPPPVLPTSAVAHDVLYFRSLPPKPPARGLVLLLTACHDYSVPVDFWTFPGLRDVTAVLLSGGYAVAAPLWYRSSRTRLKGCSEGRVEADAGQNWDLKRLRRAVPEIRRRMARELGLATETELPLFAYGLSGAASLAFHLHQTTPLAAVAAQASRVPLVLLNSTSPLPPTLLHLYVRDYFVPPAMAALFASSLALRDTPSRIVSDARWGLLSPDSPHLACPDLIPREKSGELMGWLLARGMGATYLELPLSRDPGLAMDDHVLRIPGSAPPGPIAGSAVPPGHPRFALLMDQHVQAPWLADATDRYSYLWPEARAFYERGGTIELLAWATTVPRGGGSGQGALRLFDRVRGAGTGEGGPYLACDGDPLRGECRVLRPGLSPSFLDAILADEDLGPVLRRKAGWAHELALEMCLGGLQMIHVGAGDYGGGQEVAAWFGRWGSGGR